MVLSLLQLRDMARRDIPHGLSVGRHTEYDVTGMAERRQLTRIVCGEKYRI